jgi:hypothetical protein
LFEEVVARLADPGSGELTHAQLEDQLTEDAQELMRSLYQHRLDLQAAREQRVPGGVAGADGLRHLAAIEAARQHRVELGAPWRCRDG